MSQNELLQDDARDAGSRHARRTAGLSRGRTSATTSSSASSAETGSRTACSRSRRCAHRARSIAAALGEYASPGDRVVLLVPPASSTSPRSSAACTPASWRCPRYPPNPRRADPRVHGIIADSQARVALVHASLAARLESWLALGGAPSGVRWIDVASLRHDVRRRAPGDADGVDLAMLQYTSGSTGDSARRDADAREPAPQLGDHPPRVGTPGGRQRRLLAAALSRHGADRRHRPAGVRGPSRCADGASHLPPAATALARGDGALSGDDERRAELRLRPLRGSHDRGGARVAGSVGMANVVQRRGAGAGGHHRAVRGGVRRRAGCVRTSCCRATGWRRARCSSRAGRRSSR